MRVCARVRVCLCDVQHLSISYLAESWKLQILPSFSQTHTLTNTHTSKHTHTHYLFHTYAHTHYLSLSLSLSHTHTHTHERTHTLPHTHTHLMMSEEKGFGMSSFLVENSKLQSLHICPVKRVK